MTTQSIYPLIYIEWCDSISHDSEWMSAESAIEWAKDDDWIIKQAAFLVKETKEYLLLVSKLNAHPDHEDEPMIRGLIKIPKTWIRKRVVLSKAG